MSAEFAGKWRGGEWPVLLITLVTAACGVESFSWTQMEQVVNVHVGKPAPDNKKSEPVKSKRSAGPTKAPAL